MRTGSVRASVLLCAIVVAFLLPQPAAQAVPHTKLLQTWTDLELDATTVAAGGTITASALVWVNFGGGDWRPVAGALVTFSIDGVPVITTPTTLPYGRATVVLSAGDVGTHSITATYAGDATRRGSKRTVSYQVVASL